MDNCAVAQLVERVTVNPVVPGSSPGSTANVGLGGAYDCGRDGGTHSSGVFSSNNLARLNRYDVFDVAFSDIYIDFDFNCRNAFTFQSVKILADSIAEKGLAIPVILQRREDSQLNFQEPYRLVAGFRRVTAIQTFLNWTHIPANIRPDLSDRAAEVLNLTENLERQDLNPLEEAQAIARRFPRTASLRQIAEEMHQDTRWVHQRRRLMELPEELREKVAARMLTLLDVDVLVKLPPEEQMKAAEVIINARSRRTKKLNVDPRYRRKFKYRRGKEQINERIAELMDEGLDGLATRAMAWCAGYITDEDLDQDILEAKGQNHVTKNDRAVLS